MPKTENETNSAQRADLKTYEVTEAREFFGQWRDVGTPLELTERQAKYYMPPLGAGLKLKASPVAKEAKSAG